LLEDNFRKKFKRKTGLSWLAGLKAINFQMVALALLGFFALKIKIVKLNIGTILLNKLTEVLKGS